VTPHLGESVRVPGPRCLDCGAVLTGAAQLGGEGGPSDGDVSVCSYCGAVALYLDDGEGGFLLRRPSPAEWRELATDSDVTRVREAVAELIRQRRHSAP
jgi:hypothetical protein